MSAPEPTPSARKTELLEAAYAFALEHGLADLSLRPVAAAIGSSPRVLMFLFGNKDGLVKALLARARADELRMIEPLHSSATGLPEAVSHVWTWLAVLAACQPDPERTSDHGLTLRTLALANLRGALLDLLATGDVERVTAAVELQAAALEGSAEQILFE